MENRFFKPYKSMYVDMKLPEIAQIRKDRYDEARNQYDQLQRAVGAIRLMNDGEESVKNKLLADIDTMISGNIGFENMGRTIADATTRFMTDTKLMDAMDSKATADKEKEVADKLRMEKGDNAWLDFAKQYEKDADGNIVYDPVTKAPVQTDLRDKWNTESMGIYSPRGEAKLDWDMKMLTWLQGINEDPVLLQRGRKLGIDIPYILASGTEVSQDKLDLVADLLAESFANETPEGQQMMRNYMQLQIDPTTNGKNTYSQERAKEEIKKHLLSLGAKQVGGKYQYMFDQYGIEMAKAAAAAPSSIKPLSTLNIADAHPSFIDFDPADIDGVNLQDLLLSNEYGGTINFKTGEKTAVQKFISNEDFKKEVDAIGGFGSFASAEYLKTRKPQMYRYLLTSNEFAPDRKDLEEQGITDKQSQLKAMVRAMRSAVEREEAHVQEGSRPTINSMVARGIQDAASKIKLVREGTSQDVKFAELQSELAGTFGHEEFTEQLLESLGPDGLASVTLETSGPDAGYFVYNGYIKAAESGFAGTGGTLEDGRVKFKLKTVEEQDKGFSIIRSIYEMLDNKKPEADIRFTSEMRDYLSAASGVDLSGAEIKVRRKLALTPLGPTYVPELMVDGRALVNGLGWVKALSDKAVAEFNAANGGNAIGTLFPAAREKNDNRFAK